MDYYDQIEAYINGTLSYIERIAFEEAMKADPALQQAVKDHDVAMDIVGSILESEVRQVIDAEMSSGKGTEDDRISIDEEGKSESVTVKRINWMRWAAAAAMVFVVGWWGVQQYQFNQLENDIYANYYESPKISVSRGLPSNPTQRDSIEYFFSVNDFYTSLDVLERANPTEEEIYITKFKVHNYFKLKDYSKVISLLENKDPTELELRKVLIFSYLLDGQKSKAKELFLSSASDIRGSLSGIFS
ncbi:MAG: hypothetical protein P1U56_19405 [Saprospiraceae bacterium]|nr:hypothetical protein [Saprospiraceae bacterium]